MIPAGLQTLTLFVVVISFDQQGKPYESRFGVIALAVSGE